MNDRAVSDIVGYVLVFSLIVATVGVVTTVGFSTLDDRQGAERVNNVERAFDVFAANVEDVYRDGAPSRATEMRLAGGTLRFGEAVTVTIADANDTNTNVTVSSRPLVYEDGGTEIVYSGGAVIRSERAAAVMIRDPPFYAGDDTAVFPLVETFRSSGPRTVSTEGTVRVTSTSRSVSTDIPDELAEAEAYELVVESPRADAWARHLESREWTGDVTHDDGAVVAEIDSDRIAISRAPVRLRLSE